LWWPTQAAANLADIGFAVDRKACNKAASEVGCRHAVWIYGVKKFLVLSGLWIVGKVSRDKVVILANIDPERN
jgi:hypothetical protein